MSFADLAELKVVKALIDELHELHWFAEKQGKRERARQLAEQLTGAQAERKKLVDRIADTADGSVKVG